MPTLLRKRSFTLIEIMVVIALIAVALGAMSYPIAQALRKEKFERGVDQVIARLALAQEIMLDFQTDVSLNLKIDKDGIFTCKIETGLALPDTLMKGLSHYEEIGGITAICFNHEIRKNIEIRFEGSIGTVSCGQLVLMGAGREAHLCLPGYPSQIKRSEHEPTPPSQPDYPQEIFSAV